MRLKSLLALPGLALALAGCAGHDGSSATPRSVTLDPPVVDNLLTAGVEGYFLRAHGFTPVDYRAEVVEGLDAGTIDGYETPSNSNYFLYFLYHAPRVTGTYHVKATAIARDGQEYSQTATVTVVRVP